MKGQALTGEAVPTWFGAGDDGRGEADAAVSTPAGVVAGLAKGTTGAVCAQAATKNTMSTSRPAE
jgi:hypothetical protein